jgi:hypothetical protein
MSSYYAPRPPIASVVTYHYDNGYEFSYSPSLWSPGFELGSKTDSVRRKKPSVLWANPTPNGTHVRYKSLRTPVSWYEPFYGNGSFIRYTDMDPGSYTPNGYIGLNPNPDWQTKLRLAIKDQKVNLAQTLAEYGQAQKMFVSNATTIAESLRALRRGDYKKVFKTLKLPPKQLRGTISNRWLELQYGWMPLLQDLHGTVEELQASFARPRTRKINVRATAEEREIRDHQGWIPALQRYGKTDSYAKTTVKVVAYLRQESLTSSRLGFTNPVNLAWELLPYSFVIDWFIPIGDWLNSLDAAIGLDGIIGTVTTKTKYISTNDYGGQYYLYETYHRAVLDGIPDAPLPRWSPSLGWKQVANALALLSQLKR